MVLLGGFFLTACGEKEEVHFKVMAPLGSPSLAQTYMEKTLPSLGENVTYEVDVVVGTDPLIAAFGSGSHDVIYAPTNLGAKLISTGIEYKFAGTVVWGNLYIATGSDTELTLDDLEGKEIVAFGINATPDVVLQTVLDNHTFVTAPTIRYVDSANMAQAELMADQSTIILTAEPLLSVLSLPSNVANLKYINLQDEWAKVTGNSSYPQAGIFVKSDLDSDVVEAYLEKVENSIAEALADPAKVAGYAVELDYGLPLPVLTSAIPRSNLNFQSASDSKAALETYFNYILDFNGALIGGKLPSDDFYFGE
jgi:NitT/TauT family transport system substrate-binding protein